LPVSGLKMGVSAALTLENALRSNRYRGLFRLYRQLEFHATCRYEANNYPKFNAVHVMSAIDADYLKHLNENIRTVVIPNGVDDTLFKLATATRGKTEVLFIAKLVGENITSLQSFLSEGWTYVRKVHPSAVLHVVGNITSEASLIKPMAERIGGVCFHGYVPVLSDAYKNCGIAIVPINKNCGIINKAIEGMAAGLAVVGFRQAFAGISEAEDKTHNISVKTYTEMGNAISALISNPDQLRLIQDSAHRLAMSNYTWASRSKPYEALYRNAIPKGVSNVES